MWPWKVPKRPGFLAEVTVNPFGDLATLDNTFKKCRLSSRFEAILEMAATCVRIPRRGKIKFLVEHLAKGSYTDKLANEELRWCCIKVFLKTG
jgi:hypothetical protein